MLFQAVLFLSGVKSTKIKTNMASIRPIVPATISKKDVLLFMIHSFLCIIKPYSILLVMSIKNPEQKSQGV